MRQINLTEAARLAGISRATLNRHIRSGHVIKSIDAAGKPFIGADELERVYGVLAPEDGAPVASPLPDEPAGLPSQSGPPVSPSAAPSPGSVRAILDAAAAHVAETERSFQRDWDSSAFSIDRPAPAQIARLEMDRGSDRDGSNETCNTDLGAVSSLLQTMTVELAATRASLSRIEEKIPAPLIPAPMGLVARVCVSLALVWCVIGGVYMAGVWAGYGLDETVDLGRRGVLALYREVLNLVTVLLPSLWPSL